MLRCTTNTFVYLKILPVMCIFIGGSLLNNELILSRNVKTTPFSYPREIKPNNSDSIHFSREGGRRYRTTCEI